MATKKKSTKAANAVKKASPVVEKNDSKLAAAVDNLTISIAEVCSDVKNLRQEVFNNNKII